ncbi:unnamed protein product [Closterium sp. NIES-54]
MFWTSSVTKVAACGSATCESQGPVACRPLSTDEELWCRAMETGTGLGVVGLQFSGQLSLEKVQQAAKELGSKFPLLLARVVRQGKTGGPLELHLCRDPKPITVAARSIDDVAAWEAAAPLDNDPSSLENREEPDVAKKFQGSDVYGDARGEGEKSTSAMEAEFKKLSAADVADGRGVEVEEEEEEEEDAFEDAEDGDGDDADGNVVESR